MIEPIVSILMLEVSVSPVRMVRKTIVPCLVEVDNVSVEVRVVVGMV